MCYDLQVYMFLFYNKINILNIFDFFRLSGQDARARVSTSTFFAPF